MEFAFGSGLMWGIRNDVANGTPRRYGALQDVEISFNGEVKELFAQNEFALDVARGKVKIQGKAKMASISAQTWNDLIFGQTVTTGPSAANLIAYGEGPTSIPATPFQITTVHAANWTTDLGVLNSATGIPFTQVAASPAAGQYSVAAGVYTFSSADHTSNISVIIDYVYTGTGFKFSGNNPLMGFAPRFMGVFSNNFEGQTLTLILYSCVMTKWSLPTKIDDYTIQDVEFSAFANAANQTFDLTTTLQ